MFRDLLQPTHHASVGIIGVRNSDEGDLLLIQHKDDGYPIKGYRNTYCLPGGNWRTRDQHSPRDTLIVEFNDEFLGKNREHVAVNGPLVEAVQAAVRPYGHFFVHVPARVSLGKTYNFDVSVSEAWIDQEFYRAHKDAFHQRQYEHGIPFATFPYAEGRMAILDATDLKNPQRYAFYDRLMGVFFLERGIDAQINFDPHIINEPMSDDPFAPYSTMDLSPYTINPLIEEKGPDALFKGR